MHVSIVLQKYYSIRMKIEEEYLVFYFKNKKRNKKALIKHICCIKAILFPAIIFWKIFIKNYILTISIVFPKKVEYISILSTFLFKDFS